MEKRSKVGLDYDNSRGRKVNIICEKLVYDNGDTAYKVDRKGGGFSFWHIEGDKIVHAVRLAKGNLRTMSVGTLNEEVFIKRISNHNTPIEEVIWMLS